MHKILVVDDDKDLLNSIQTVLEMNGFEVAITPRWEETIKIVEEFEPDLVILDVFLFGKDGRIICKKLKFVEKTRHIPIIIFSADPRAGDTVMEYGANDFIEKPFDVDKLLYKINYNLEKARPETALD